MTTYKLSPLKLVALRFTLLDACGVPNTGSCATFASRNWVSVDQTADVTDAVEHQWINGDGVLELYQTDQPQLKALSLEVMATQITPQLVNWMTGDPLVNNDAASPSAVGWSTGVVQTPSNFALEGWVRLGDQGDCAGTAYGYVVWPWCYNGTFYEIKHENAPSDLKIMAKTRSGSPWGTGPYSVVLSAAAATLGEPMSLFRSVSAYEHRMFLRTTLAPPVASVDCSAVAGAMTVVDDDAAGAGLDATATIPTDATTPGFIDWGDAGGAVAVASGAATAVHTYGMAGAYTVTYRSTLASEKVWTGSVTMA